MTTSKPVNPGIGHILLHRQIRTLQAEIEIKDRVILKLEKQMAAQGLTLKGWWCFSCDIFNSSEKEELAHCRCCGTIKPNPMGI